MLHAPTYVFLHEKVVALDSILSRLTAHQTPPIENSTMSGIKEVPLPGGVLGLIEVEVSRCALDIFKFDFRQPE